MIRALALCLMTSVACTAESRQDAASRPAASASFPPVVELSLGKQHDINVTTRIGGDEVRLAGAPDGAAWVFAVSEMKTIYWCMRRNDTWTPLVKMPTNGWEFIERIAVATDKASQPIVVWAGFDDTPGMAVAWSRWTGTGWTPSELLDRLETSAAVSDLSSLRDAQGMIHLAYDRPMKPRESYNRGGHGMFPSKCWHAIYDGNRWSKPTPTTGTGRLDLRVLGLTIGPAGTIVLAEHVAPAHSPQYVGEQRWDGKVWSDIAKFKEGTAGGLVASPWGDRLVWYGMDLSYGASLVREKRESPITWGSWGEHVRVTNDRAGRIAVYSPVGNGGSVRAWNGDQWSNEIECGEASELVAMPNGNLLVADWKRDTVRIREIVVREAGVNAASGHTDAFTQRKSSSPPDLNEAVRSHNTDRVLQVLSTNPGLAQARDRSGVTPLMVAAEEGQIDIAQVLLDFGAEPDRENFEHIRPLHVAAMRGDTKLARLLLDHGASVNAEDSQGETALGIAEAGGFKELASLLKSRGGTDIDYAAQIVAAVRKGNQDAVKKLLDRGIGVETSVPNGHSLLDFAAETGNVEMAKFIISKGAVVRRADKYGRTALYWASGEARSAMVTYLIRQGADPNAREGEGKTALHAAVDNAQRKPDESLQTIKNLIAGGADINARNNAGVTPLGHAKRYGTDAVREYLRAHGGME